MTFTYQAQHQFIVLTCSYACFITLHNIFAWHWHEFMCLFMPCFSRLYIFHLLLYMSYFFLLVVSWNIFNPLPFHLKKRSASWQVVCVKTNLDGNAMYYIQFTCPQLIVYAFCKYVRRCVTDNRSGLFIYNLWHLKAGFWKLVVNHTCKSTIRSLCKRQEVTDALKWRIFIFQSAWNCRGSLQTWLKKLRDTQHMAHFNSRCWELSKHHYL